MEMKTYVVEEIATLASTLINYSATKHTEGATVLALSGNLGAGKTTLVQAIGVALGVSDVITSPTFVVMKRYQTANETYTELVHIDAYRIETANEMEVLGFSAVLATPGVLVCIEWPEKISPLIPKTAIRVTLETVDTVTRKIAYE